MTASVSAATRIVIEPGAEPTVRRAADYLTDQIRRRTGWSWTVSEGGAQPGDVVLVHGREFSAEEIAVTAGADRTEVQFADSRSAIAAAGLFLRSITFSATGPQWNVGTVRRRPAYPVRGHTIACHRQNNTADKWELADWEEYLTELAAWGDNTVIVYPLHPARWPHALPFAGEPWFDTPERAAEFDRQWRIHCALPQIAHELGLRYGAWLPVNDVFPEQVAREPELTRNGGAYACPARPRARAAIHEIRDRLFSQLSALDVLFLPSKDDGGCPGCPDCTPWTPTYIALLTEQIQQARTHHPQCSVWLSTQGLDDAEATSLFSWLDRERPPWVEALAAGPFGETITYGGDSPLALTTYRRSGLISGPIARARAALPGDYQLILYPDETHTFRCQYPIVGMDPAVRYVWAREDGPAPRPSRMAQLHRETSPFSDGATPYSEGDTDDLNKFVWSALGVDPERDVRDIVGEYCRWYFGPAGERATEICFALERLLGGPIVGDPLVRQTLDTVRECDARCPELSESWRWQLLRLTALMLAHIGAVQDRDRELGANLRYRLAAFDHQLDPRADLDSTVRELNRSLHENDDLLADVVATRDRLFDLHRLAVRGVSRLQNSYQHWDLVAEKWAATRQQLDDSAYLADNPAWRRELNTALQEAETASVAAVQGKSVVAPLNEAPWERATAGRPARD